MKKAGRMTSIFTAAAVLSAMAFAPAVFPLASHAHEGHDDDGGYPTIPFRTYDNPNIVQFKYDYVMSPDLTPEYNAIVKAMKPAFAGTAADLDLPYPLNPPLNVAEFDLNNDGVEELIAVPIETTEDYFCGGNYHQCPHYILERTKNGMRVLGVIRAFAIDRGDSIKNGFWTLKVFPDSRLPEFSPQIDIYSFDRKKRTFVKDMRP